MNEAAIRIHALTDAERLKSFRRVLEIRSKTLRAIRAFFHDRAYLEVETPVRIPAPAIETHIDAEPSGEMFLRTSPELHMKRLLASDCKRLFQLGPCFRQGERGPLHHPEYTMLEWYRAGADYMDILAETRTLLAFVAREATGTTLVERDGKTIDLAGPWDTITVSDAFKLHAGWDPAGHFDADRFDLDLVEKVEPRLSGDSPVVLKDYPEEAGALARRRKDMPAVAERWELYIGGIELANAYSELTDPREQRERFEEAASMRRVLGKCVYPLDEAFMEALESGMPEAGGIALGVDRLVMLLAGAATLNEVLPFRD